MVSVEKTNIKNLSREQLSQELQELGVATYRLTQVIRWLYQQDISDFDEMSNLSKDLRVRLKEKYSIEQWAPHTTQKSEDGTIKFLFQLQDGKTIESVMIPNETRNTLCISSQVGCAMACSFCLTGTLGLTRNLTQFEILEQIIASQRYLGEENRISNIVFMGMGEPFHNYKNVISSLDFMVDDLALGLAQRRITVSTSGLVPQIRQFAEDSKVKLAISLTASLDEQRDQLIPVNKKYPLKELFRACQHYYSIRKQRITFEYTLLKGVNDSPDDARRLVKLLRQVPCKLNLIPFNSFEGSPFERLEDERMYAFQNITAAAGIQTNIRKSRGRDILGACGQLKAEMDQRPENIQRQVQASEALSV